MTVTINSDTLDKLVQEGGDKLSERVVERLLGLLWEYSHYDHQNGMATKESLGQALGDGIVALFTIAKQKDIDSEIIKKQIEYLLGG